MRKIEYFKKGTCLFAAVLMLVACGGQADKMETQPAETTAQIMAETTLAESSDSGEKESTAEKETKEDASQSKDQDKTQKDETEEESSEEKSKEESTQEAEESKDAKSQDSQSLEKPEDDQKELKEETQGQDEKASDAAAEEASKAAAEEASKAAEAASKAAQEASKAAKEQAEAAAAQQSDGKNVNEIYSEITQKVALNTPMVVPNDFITNYYGIDLGVLDEYVFSMSESATSAETVVILKAKDAGSTGSLSASLQTVVDQKRAEMENYLPDQFQIVDKSSVQVKGNYVYLVISEQADAISQIIQAGIR